MEIYFKFGLVLLLVLLNGYFVASEFALVAIRKTRVDELARKGHSTGKILQKALGNLDHYISATQLGITLASLALGWIGEPAVAHFLESYLRILPAESKILNTQALSIIIAFSIITFLHIVIGELAPKSIALQKAESTALVIIRPLIIFSQIFKPFIWLLNNTGHLVIRALHIAPPSGKQLLHSEEEVRMILRQSSEGGVLSPKEVEMVYNVFQLSDTPVKVIMVPRTEILAFSLTTTLKQVVKKIAIHPHSRFPVYEETIDNIVGFIHVKDVYQALIKKGGEKRLSQLKIIRDVITVPEIKKIDAVLQEMRKKRIHLAVINDEFGGTTGVITLEDIIESLVGEIDDEFDRPNKDITKQKDGSYIVQGYTPIEDIRLRFHLVLRGQGYATIGGLVFGLLGHEPHVGDEVEISKLTMQVIEVDGKRIKTIKIKRLRKREKN